MWQVPKIIEKIVVKQAALVYWQSYHFNHRWADLVDFKQEAYLKLHKVGLWKCEDPTLIYLTVKSACIDYMRKNIPGHEQYKPINYVDDLVTCLRTKSDSGGLDNKADCNIALRQMLDVLPKVQQGIVKSLIEGSTQKEISEQLGVTESRISQIRKEIIDKLFELETGRVKKKIPNRDKRGLFAKPKQEPKIRFMDFKGFCIVHPKRKVFNKKRQICWSCYQKLLYLKLLKAHENVYLAFLKRRLLKGEVDKIRRTFGS